MDILNKQDHNKALYRLNSMISDVKSFQSNRQYKKIYRAISKFINQYDYYNQIHINDRIWLYNQMNYSLLKILKKVQLKDMSRKNKIEKNLQSQEIESLLKALNVISARYHNSIQYLLGEFTKSYMSDQQLDFNSRPKFQLQTIQTINVERELENFFYLYQKGLRWFSYQQRNLDSYNYAKQSLRIVKMIIENGSKVKLKWIINYVNNCTNYMITCYEFGFMEDAYQVIQDMENSNVLLILQTMIRQIDSTTVDQKQKVTVKNQQISLSKCLIWFWIQSIYIYQHRLNFARCFEIIQYLKWFSSNFLRQNDELINYILSISQLTFLKYREELIFSEKILELCEGQFYFNWIENKIHQQDTQQKNKLQYQQGLQYYYSQKQRTDQQPKVFHIQSGYKSNNNQSDLAFIDVAKFQEDLSSIETRQSSFAFINNKKKQLSQLTNQSHTQHITKNDTQLSENSIRKLSLHLSNGSQSQIPLLDKIMRNIIDSKLQIPDVTQNDNHKDRIITKENQFYKKLLKHKKDYEKLQTKQKEKYNQEIIIQIGTKAQHQENLRLLSKLRIKEVIKEETKPTDNISLLSFEKPGKKLSPMQKLRKIIFSHPEVFYLQALRNKLKAKKKWYYKRGSTVQINRSGSGSIKRGSVSHRRTSAKEEDESVKLGVLRNRSQQQLKQSLTETESRVNDANKELNSIKRKELISRKEILLKKSFNSERNTLNLQKMYLNLYASIKSKFQ
ncbi:hypothetical protein pb186bvf_004462 [Paramecium bursaria]